MEFKAHEAHSKLSAHTRVGEADRRRTEGWPHLEQAELVDQFNALGPERLVKVLLFERIGDVVSRAEGVWVLIADGSQDAGIGVLLSNVISLKGRVPRRGDLVEYRTINTEHKPYVVAWVDGRGD